MDEIEAAAHGTPAVTAGAARVVTCDLTFDVAEPSEIVLQLMASRSAGGVVDERFETHTEGTAGPAVVELSGPHGARVQVLHAPPGRLGIAYRSEIAPGAAASTEDAAEFSRLVYLRPSRYCPSDHLVGFAVAEFGTGSTVRGRVADICAWIGQRVGYVAGSSSVHDSAEDTLLTGMGTCRDFAHLGVALSRAVGIPSRFAAVYAPGLSPMDFHAVFETLEENGRWYAHDATGLAPRPSMVRIVTGRDAADAPFASVNSGIAALESIEITATVGGTLPDDDHRLAFELP
jgi:transglutaminase-like putative cysteine protease